MSAHSLRSAIKLTRKALVELKLSSRLVTDRKRRQEIELKIRAIEKLLNRADNKIDNAAQSAPVEDYSAKRFKNLNLEPATLDQLEKKLKHFKEHRSTKLNDDEDFFKSSISDSAILDKNMRYQKKTQAIPFWKQSIQLMARPFQKLKNAFRQPSVFNRTNRQESKKPY